MGVALSGNLRGDFKKVSEAVTEAQNNPVRTTDRVAKALGARRAFLARFTDHLEDVGVRVGLPFQI